MLNVKKLGINNIFFVIAITILIIAASTCVFYSTVDNTVLAETTSDSILNFNQLVSNDYINFYNDYKDTTYTTKVVCKDLNANFYNHKIYLNLEMDYSGEFRFKYILQNDYTEYNINYFTGNQNIIIDFNSTSDRLSGFGFYIMKATNIKNLQLIDLTIMYGSGNEPNLQECKNIFTTTYNYTTSYLINTDSFKIYTDGVDSINKSLTISEPVSNWINNTYNVDAAEYVVNDNGTIGWSKGNIATKFDYTLKANDYINLSLNVYGTPSTNTLSVYQLDQNGNYTLLVDVDYSKWRYGGSGTLGYYYGNFTIKLKYDCSQIYFNTTSNIIVVNKVEYITYNYDNQLLNAFQQGANSIDTNYYYQKGVADGKIQGAAQGTAWGNSWEFISSCFSGVGDILAIEILPNLPLYTFIAIPLLLGLIVLIYKLIGSGG